MKTILYIVLTIVIIGLIVLAIRYYQCKNKKQVVARFFASRQSAEGDPAFTGTNTSTISANDLIQGAKPCNFFSFN